MKTQNQYLKPQDVVVLLKIISLNNPKWKQKRLADEIGLSQSEVSEAVARCKYANLLDTKGKTVMKSGLLELIQYGLPYIFPQKPGAVVRGVPTSHSTMPLKEHIESAENYVWPYGKGTMRGHSIVPLYPSVPEAALQDEKLHQLLALVDALRVGRSRERTIALLALKKLMGIGE